MIAKNSSPIFAASVLGFPPIAKAMLFGAEYCGGLSLLKTVAESWKNKLMQAIH
jgi:hypothetical protein